MIWTKATGIVNLNTAVVSSDWTLNVANAINGKGKIAGNPFQSGFAESGFHSGAQMIAAIAPLIPFASAERAVTRFIVRAIAAAADRQLR